MALVQSFQPSSIEENEYIQYHRNKIESAKQTLRFLRVRLRLLQTSNNQVQRELLADLTKLEHALSIAVHDMQKKFAKRNIAQLAVERSILSTLLFVFKRKIFDSNRRNEIEQSVVDNLKIMLSQTESLQKKMQLSDEEFSKITTSRDEFADVADTIFEKLRNEEKSESDHNRRRKIAQKCSKINLLRMFFSVLVAGNPILGKKGLHLTRKWRAVRSYEYYKKRCLTHE